MYSLDAVLDPVSRAVEACKRGDYTEAEAVLATALPSEAATVWYLACKIQMCLGGIGIPFSNVQCHPAFESKQEEQEDPASKTSAEEPKDDKQQEQEERERERGRDPTSN